VFYRLLPSRHDALIVCKERPKHNQNLSSDIYGAGIRSTNFPNSG